MADTNGACPALDALLEYLRQQEQLYAEKAVRTHDKPHTSSTARLISAVLARVLDRGIEMQQRHCDGG